MNKREKVLSILNRKNEGTCASWIGNPDEKTLEIYNKELNLTSLDELQLHFDDDCRWLHVDRFYNDGKHNKLFYFGGKEHSLEVRALADIETVEEIEALDFGDIKHFDFAPAGRMMEKWQDKAVFSGLWSPFFHDMADLLGMEEYFVKMYTHPEVIEAITEKIVDIYVAANERYFQEYGDKFDTFFFGNDFGTQIDTLISIDSFKKFVLPSFKRLINIAKKYDKKVILHSCGAISKVIPLIIDAGIDGLHPIQAKAAGMDAKTLQREFGKDVAFMGGIDTQDLLVNASPQEIYDEVMRLRDIFGGNFIASPSHEAILPNVSLKNFEAMVKAIKA